MIKRVLITGGAGFLGSHLCENFLNKGAKVIAVDNLITGSMTNIEHLLKNPRFPNDSCIWSLLFMWGNNIQ